jgi:apolipoprotein N-acyltransferase
MWFCLLGGIVWLLPICWWSGDAFARLFDVPRHLGLVVMLALTVVESLHLPIFAAVVWGVRRTVVRGSGLLMSLLFVAVEALPIRPFHWSVAHGITWTPPLSVASVLGIEGVALLVACAATLVYEGVGRLGRSKRLVLGSRASASLLVLGALLATTGLLTPSTDSASHPQRLRVAICQPNALSDLSPSRVQRMAGLGRVAIGAAVRSIRSAVEGNADLICLPEATLVDPIERDRVSLIDNGLAAAGLDLSLLDGRALLLGVHLIPSGFKYGDALPRLTNSACLRIATDGKTTWRIYDKVHLMPLAETPLLGLGRDEYVPGAAPSESFSFAGRDFAVVICYEDSLPEYVRMLLQGGQDSFIVSLSNDAWLGSEGGPFLRLQMSRFRAIENGVPVLRSTTTGISAVIDPGGHVDGRVTTGREGVLFADVAAGVGGRTVFGFGGWLFRWVLIGALVSVLLWVRFKRAPAGASGGQARSGSTPR